MTWGCAGSSSSPSTRPPASVAAGLRHQAIVHGRVAGALRDEVDAFLAAVRDGTAPPVGLDDARRALMLTAAAEASLAKGQPVALGA